MMREASAVGIDFLRDTRWIYKRCKGLARTPVLKIPQVSAIAENLEEIFASSIQRLD